MNGVHDMGGMHGFGRVKREENEPVFHADWEKTVVSINRIAGAHGFYNIDQSRYGIERMEPAKYLSYSYYERWLDAAIRNLTAKGVIKPEELDAWISRLQENPETPLPEPADPTLTDKLLEKVRGGRNYRRSGSEPIYQVGDAVVTQNLNTRGHTRLPRYARGKRGVIHAVRGVFVFPDTSGMGEGDHPQPLYTVRFTAGELWADSAEPNSTVCLDLWESYLTTPAA